MADPTIDHPQVVHRRQIWWCEFINEPFFPIWEGGEDGRWACPVCGADDLRNSVLHQLVGWTTKNKREDGRYGLKEAEPGVFPLESTDG